MPTKRVEYTDLASGVEKVRESFGPANDIPSGTKGKVYFRYPIDRGDGRPMLVECDLSPDALLEPQPGGGKKLTKGHLRLLCPSCASEGRMSPLHIMADNKAVFVFDDALHLLRHEASDGNLYLLPTFTVVERIMCDYREPGAGGCTWAAHIVEGRAVPAQGLGQIFLARR